jgi:hypothetical protein
MINSTPTKGGEMHNHICTEVCTPGNCEKAHREHFGWDAVEAGAAFDRDNEKG